MANVRGKSSKSLAVDVAEGYIAVNPLFLKAFEHEDLKEFFNELEKTQRGLRSEKFPANDIQAIRIRNSKLQRLFSASMIIRNFARERRIPLI